MAQGEDGSRVFVHSCQESRTCKVALATPACAISWDGARPELLAVQVQGTEGSGSSTAVLHVDAQLAQIVLLESRQLQPDQALVGIAMPYLLVAAQGPGDGDPCITQVLLAPFVGLPLLDPSLLNAVLDFNVAVCLDSRQAMGQVCMGGKTVVFPPLLDSMPKLFYRQVQAVSRMGCGSDGWHILAHNAVRTGRLGHLGVCLEHVAHAKAAAAMRACQDGSDSEDVVLGHVAAALGMAPEAEAHFQAAGRPDLIVALHQVDSSNKK